MEHILAIAGTEQGQQQLQQLLLEQNFYVECCASNGLEARRLLDEGNPELR